MSTDWNAKFDLSKIKKEAYRARLKQMFDYMSKTEIVITVTRAITPN